MQPPKEMKHSHDKVKKFKKLDQFDLPLKMSFMGKPTSIYDVASRHKVNRALQTKNMHQVTFVLGSICNKLFNYPKVFSRNNVSEIKSDATGCLKRAADT